MPKQYEIFVSPLADRKLASHIEFLARVSDAAAKCLFTAYEDALRLLAEIPESYPTYIPLKPLEADLKYKIFSKRYRMVFEIIDRKVYLYDIQDCRQDTDKSLVD